MEGGNSDSDSRSPNAEKLLGGGEHMEASGTCCPFDSPCLAPGASSSPNIDRRPGQVRGSELDLTERSAPGSSSPTLPDLTGRPDALVVSQPLPTVEPAEGCASERSSPESASKETEDTTDSQEKVPRNIRNISRDSPKLLKL